jgi:hypothetical protein
MLPPTVQDAVAAMKSAIVYHEDPLASVLAGRLIVVEAYFIDEFSLRRAYGANWEALLGILRIAENVTPAEEAMLSDLLTLNHRRLLLIGKNWLSTLGRAGIVDDLFEDLERLCRDDVAERTLIALRCALVAGLLHQDSAADTPITIADENELTIPIRALLISRGVNL